MFLLTAAIIATVQTETFGSPNSNPNILQQLWENDVTPCEECTEVAMGEYHRDGAKKQFTLLRKSWNLAEMVATAVNLAFRNALGNKYLILSHFLPEIDKIETGQTAILPDIDPDRPRGIPAPMYEELRETNISPLFLTLSLHLAKKYSGEILHGEEMEVVVDREVRIILPHKIYLRVEEQNGYIAPVEVQMYRNDAVISTIRMKNAMVNGRLRPFWISLTSRGKTDEILINFWGIIQDNHEYFTSTGLGRGELSIPEIQSKVFCPP
ncbi:MAG: hypothetical protein G01um101470_1093, partial [Parcubacteria group bacterium Gr01-1014_70]